MTSPRPTCPKCRGALRFINGPHGGFYGCSYYPQCDGRLQADAHGQPIPEADQATQDARQEAYQALHRLCPSEEPGYRAKRAVAVAGFARRYGMEYGSGLIGRLSMEDAIRAKDHFLTLWHRQMAKRQERVKSKRAGAARC